MIFLIILSQNTPSQTLSLVNYPTNAKGHLNQEKLKLYPQLSSKLSLPKSYLP